MHDIYYGPALRSPGIKWGFGAYQLLVVEFSSTTSMTVPVAIRRSNAAPTSIYNDTTDTYERGSPLSAGRKRIAGGNSE